MKGYEIFELRNLEKYRADGITANKIKIGFLDFLRELSGDLQGIPPCSSFEVVGIDEVLYSARGEERKRIALASRKVLRTAAQALEKKKIEVQIVCKGSLFKAENFWLEYRNEKLPLDLIFGNPIKQEIRGVPVYFMGFNLSS
jgi:hypothetical protein